MPQLHIFILSKFAMLFSSQHRKQFWETNPAQNERRRHARLTIEISFEKQCISCHTHYPTLFAFCIDFYGTRNFFDNFENRQYLNYSSLS